MKKKLLVFENSISRKLGIALLIVIFANAAVFAQNRQITGKVLANGSDSALAGVTVKVKGALNSAITGADGSFTINASPNATLIISSVGFGLQQIALNNRTDITIRLITDAQALQQVVVVGYGTVKRKDVTGWDPLESTCRHASLSIL